ncbi:MAG: 16S rRNA (cytidine(1402)-2'-O)-methyltransferase [Acidobacteria bacterium]|nr:16S rRNA (cytidine(1402)-2'-O)-methyltransferase [Acidobacteriota bacterium]
MAGVLSIVATPIGNLEDITLRALRVLREADVIAAEDTRRTIKLLNHYGIAKPLLSLHDHNERTRSPWLLERLARGERVALVSDAGTPTVSDPGVRLIAEAGRRGIKVEAVPGASAVLAALASSGLPADRFVFAGFPPRGSKDLTDWLEELKPESATVVFFEAPHRIKRTLARAAEIWGEREVSVGRELTKAFEELVKGPISDVLKHLGEPRGEYTVVVGGASRGARHVPALPPSSEVLQEFWRITECATMGRREALRQLAATYGSTPKQIYTLIEEAKKLGRKT